MKLSLSTRIAKSADRKDIAAIPFEDLAPLAAFWGFKGVSMRASAISINSSHTRRTEIRDVLVHNNLAVSMVMGDVSLATNSPAATQAVRDIEPYLNLAADLGANLIRVMLHDERDIPFVRHAADQAAERVMVLSHQIHWGTLCETVENAINTVHSVDRENFGITYEPANLMACGDDYGPNAIALLAPHLVNVYFQNVKLSRTGGHTFWTRARGRVSLDYVALDDPSGLDPHLIIEALQYQGYRGWFTVHQPLRDGQSVAEAVQEAALILGPVVSVQ